MIALTTEMNAGFAAEVRAFFAADGPMAKAKEYEFRAGQQLMAGAVADALSQRRHLVAEAATGVGKSLAYLVPAVRHAVTAGRKALVSTHTINLQEQLMEKDLPLLAKLHPQLEFKAALAKGRGNYLCPRRLARALAGQEELFPDSQRAELERIARWARDTRDGTLSDLPFQPEGAVWAEVCSEPHLCSAKTCPPDSGCFYQDARRRLAEADVIVLNHTLFFTLLAGQEDVENRDTGYLFPDDFVIFDEAHTVEAVAARLVGLSVSQAAIRHQLFRLWNPRTKKGLLSRLRLGEPVEAVGRALDANDEFFRQVAEAAKFKENGREVRVRRPELVADSLARPLLAAQEALAAAAKKLGEDDDAGRLELLDHARRLAAVRSGTAEFLAQADASSVYWVERTTGTWGRDSHSLNAAPVDLASRLRALLFRPNNTVVMTSATLSVGGTGDSQLAWFRSRIGADTADVDALKVGSPFDFEKQMRLFAVRGMPDPRDAKYEDQLAHWTQEFLERSGGRAFVLFTSHRTLRSVAEKTEKWIAARGWRSFVQGGDLSRKQMLAEFRRKDAAPAVLFGAESFWNGVDVAGEALSNVIITRLPFLPPDHPLTEARTEMIEANGGDPFRELSLPEAILRLRQGVGRLIRSKQDKGIVAILDPRVVTKPYGRAFLAALPKCPLEVL